MYNGFQVLDSMRNFKKYDGNTLKFGITYDNENYIVKFQDTGLEQKTYSEYVAQRFIQGLGINCQSVWIGFYKGVKVNVIKDFTDRQSVLHSFKDTRQSSEGTDLQNKTYTYKDVIDLIEKHTKMQEVNKNKTITQFWDMFICDAILGNRDRHHGNWGYLKLFDNSGKCIDYIPSPIFDNGGSLFTDLSRKIGEYSVKGNELKFLLDRAEKFPASLFRMERSDGSVKRTNYYEMLGNLKFNDILKNEVYQIRKNIGYSGIRKVAIEVLSNAGDLIPNNYKSFYLRIIELRYLHIIERIDLKKAVKYL